MTAVKPTKGKVKPTKNKVNSKNNNKKPNNKVKSTNNNEKPKKSKVKSKKSKVKSTKSKVEPDVVYYRTDGGYYYKQTQNGGSLRVSEAEYMEGGGLFRRNKIKGTRIEEDPCSAVEEEKERIQSEYNFLKSTAEVADKMSKTRIKELEGEIVTLRSGIDKRDVKNKKYPQNRPLTAWEKRLKKSKQQRKAQKAQSLQDQRRVQRHIQQAENYDKIEIQIAQQEMQRGKPPIKKEPFFSRIKEHARIKDD